MSTYKFQLKVVKPGYLTNFHPSPHGWERFGFWLNAQCDECEKDLDQVLVPYNKKRTSDHEYVNFITECEECGNSCRIIVQNRNSDVVIENRMQHDEWVPILEFMTKGCAPTTMDSVAMDANEEWVAHSREHGVDTKTFLREITHGLLRFMWRFLQEADKVVMAMQE